MPDRASAAWRAGLLLVALVYLHNALPHLTTLPRVNVDEPWLIERAYQVMTTGVPSQPMLGLDRAYLLQVGYGYLVAPWLALFGVGILQARLLSVALGFGIVLMVAAIGRRMLDEPAAIAAALFLASDSNFLGGARMARTDIPSVFFVAAALAAYLVGRANGRAVWFCASGAALAAAMLCHGNAFWAAPILLAWFLADFGRRAFRVPFGYAFLAGVLGTLGPYLAIVLARWRDVQEQIGNFAGDRVPGWRPSFIWHQVLAEGSRYRDWYFGLVTNAVPNPLLWVFQALTVAGIAALVVHAWSRRRSGDAFGAARVVILAAGGALMFAAFINNKVAVYIPHLLIGFSLAAGYAVAGAARAAAYLWRGDRALAVRLAAGFVIAYGVASIAYYEKWYSSALKSELVPYESTVRTLRALVPPGPKYLYASPQFWTPFHADAGTRFMSFAASQSGAGDQGIVLVGAGRDRPIYLIVDEAQWLPELAPATSSGSIAWQQGWLAFIERHCALEGAAFGTAQGTLALYRCSLEGQPPQVATRMIGGVDELVVGAPVVRQTAEELAAWPRWDDPRRRASARPVVALAGNTLRIAGTGWPGIVRAITLTPGERYLVRASTNGTRDGDLLYLGTWRVPEVRSLSGGSAAGIAAPLLTHAWFPRDRAFVATAPSVQIAIYSEAAETDFSISSLDIFRLAPAPGAVHGS